MTKNLFHIALPAAALGFILAGCNDQPTLFQNPDPNLRLTKTQLLSDSESRFPYKTDAPRAAESRVRAQVHYDLKRMEIVNFTGQDIDNVDIWVNREYVCHVPKMEDRQLKEIHFPMLYNHKGETFPMDNRRTFIRTVEIYRNGTLYDVVAHAAD
jgi:hypothetical protein